jgi:hypothetical protein
MRIRAGIAERLNSYEYFNNIKYFCLQKINCLVDLYQWQFLGRIVENIIFYELGEKTMYEDRVKVGWVIAAVLIPIVGVIKGFVERGRGNLSSGNTYIAIGVISWVANYLLVHQMMK